MKCERCNGTGYQSAAREMGLEDAPKMQRPLGVWECTYCNGTGMQYNVSEMFDQFEREHPEEFEKAVQEFKEKLQKIKPNWIDPIK